MRDFPPPERFRDVVGETVAWEFVALIPWLMALVFYRPRWFLILVGVVIAGIVVEGLWRQRRRRLRLREAQTAAESSRSVG